MISSKCTKRDIWEKYTGEEEHGQLLMWMRKLGYDTGIKTRRPNFVSNPIQMKKKKTANNLTESFENLQLKKRIEDLEKQLKDKYMEINECQCLTKVILSLGKVLILKRIALDKISGKLKINRFKIPNYA